jgi:osmotically inducible protein OsmC
MAYTIKATTKGGRNGRAILENGGLALAMGLQKEFGGNGEGHNPEQLFVLGWSSCFGQAILALAKKHGLDGQDARVTCAVTMEKDEISFGFKAELTVSIPGADKDKVKALVEDAHKICPYSRATRGNVPVTLTVA